jgi:nucleolar protein 9
LAEIDESDYMGTLLRDPNSSRLLEIIATRCPDDTFGALWKTYFKGKLPRLATHPTANFVVAKTIERLSEVQLSEACDELGDTWNRVIRKFHASSLLLTYLTFSIKGTARTGVLRAVIEKAAVSERLSQTISDVRSFTVPDWFVFTESGPFKIVSLAFDITDPADRTYVVPCVLNLSPLQVSK